jgi:hypothetical protein
MPSPERRSLDDEIDLPTAGPTALGGSELRSRSACAFYYVRVLEIPKPRWTAYDVKFYRIKMPEDTRMTVQDRARTLPIWYTSAS